MRNMHYNSSRLDGFVFNAPLDEVRDALVARFSAEVDVEQGQDTEYLLTLNNGDEILESPVYEGEWGGKPGVNVRSVYFDGDFHWWAEEIFKCLTDALPYDVVINQNSVNPCFELRRENGRVTRRDYTISS